MAAAAWLLLYFVFGWSIRRELFVYKSAPRAICYVVVLALEIIKSSVAVLPYIWGRKKRPDGEIIQFESGLKTETANVILANSITLTPGTITIREKDGMFTVHCLNPELARGIDGSIFLRLLKKMEESLDT